MIYIINLFGTGIRYWICDIPIQMYEEMNIIRLKHKVEWENLLFDFDFMKHFGYNHWSEMASQKEQTGFLITSENRIEIKQKARFISRFRAAVLLNQDTLFPLYKTTFDPNKLAFKDGHKRVIMIQYEKGLIGKYILETEFFLIENLDFRLSSINDLTFLSSIQYEGKSLKNTQQDSLVVGSLVELVA